MESDHYGECQFPNTTPKKPNSFSQTLGLFVRFFTKKQVNTTPDIDMPVRPLKQEDLAALNNKACHTLSLTVSKATWNSGGSALMKL